jgi:hypothetical protein
MGIRNILAATAAATIAVSGMAAEARAERPASPTERRAIQVIALRHCPVGGGDPCRRAPVKVSTVDPRYAFGGAIGDGYSGVLVKRESGHWRVVAVQGGGLMSCSYWEAAAPVSVIRDLRLDGISSEYPNGGPC